MEYITVKEAADKWNTSVQIVRRFCRQERIPGIIQRDGAWLIPENAKKPGRTDPAVAEIEKLTVRSTPWQRPQNCRLWQRS